MTVRALTTIAVFVAAALFAAAEPTVQVRKGVTLLHNEKPNTYLVSLRFRVVEEAGENTEKRNVVVADSLPEQLTLVRGELSRKFAVQSVEVDARPNDGWTTTEYVVRADKVRFTLANQSYDIDIPPSRIAVLESDQDDAQAIYTQSSETVTVHATMQLPKATIL